MRSPPRDHVGVNQTEDSAACAASVDPGVFEEKFGLAAGLAPVYPRRDLRANALLYMRGLLMPVAVGNCWSIGEAVGLGRPYRLQHLLNRSSWDEEAARDAERAFLALCRARIGAQLLTCPFMSSTD